MQNEMSSSRNDYIVDTAIALHNALDGKTLIQFDRFGQAMRNTYSINEFSFLVPKIAVCHYNTWSQSIVQPGTVFSREELQRTRTKDSGVGYDLPFEKAVLESVNSDRVRPVFKVWFSTPDREEMAKICGAKIIAVSPEIRNFVENKTNLPVLFENSCVNNDCQLRSQSYVNAQNVPDYTECNRVFGTIFVMQGESIGGNGTRIIRSESDFQRAIQDLQGSIKVTEFFEGQSSNTTIVTVPSSDGGCKVLVDIPSHKSTGIPDTGIHETLGAGNDWFQAYPEPLVRRFIESVELLGRYLYETYGLVGIWGVDSIWSKDQVKINEINCRLQGTTEESAINQILRGFPPFIAIHLLAYLGGDTSFLPSQEAFNRETVQLASRERLAPFYIKIKQKYDRPVRLKDAATVSGKYRLLGNELIFVSPALSSTEASLQDNEVIIADLPMADTVCHPKSELCTICGLTEQKIFDGPHGLSVISKQLTQAVYDKFEFFEKN